MTIAAFFMSIALSAGLVMMLGRSSLASWSLDHPNHRSLHRKPTPRIGGVAIVLGVAISLLLLHPHGLPGTALALAATLALVSFLDDRAHLPVALRLAAHIAAAIFMVYSWTIYFSLGSPPGARHTLVLLASPFAALALVAAICWMTNLYNFMDGANGLAGGMALIGFGGFAVAASMTSGEDGAAMAAAAAALSGAALGFLIFNFPAGRVFMGDTGSVAIGFLAAALAIEGCLKVLWPWWFGVLAFSPFIVDATATLFKRIAKREKVWMAHRQHYYQRLILSGWSHRRTVISYYFLMLGSTGSALAAQNSHFLYPIVSFWVITYASLLVYLEWRFYKQEKDKTE
ncbi:MAG: glycosyltransferase family 4 protein [Betaproteobacteria bacterium]